MDEGSLLQQLQQYEILNGTTWQVSGKIKGACGCGRRMLYHYMNTKMVYCSEEERQERMALAIIWYMAYVMQSYYYQA